MENINIKELLFYSEKEGLTAKIVDTENVSQFNTAYVGIDSVSV